MARNFMPQSGALAPYVVVNRDAAVAGVFSVDGLRGSVDLTTKYLTIANFNAYKTTTDGSISSINQSITALNTAVSNKAAKGANSDITSITGLTTALGIAYGGTGGKTVAEARTNLGLTTAATTSIGTDGARIPLLNGVNTWATNQTFSSTQTIFSNVSPGGIEIGSSGTAGIAYIDLHSSGTGNDYDVRIQSDGGNNTVGRGTLSISATLVKLPALELTSPLGVAFGGTGANSIEGTRSALSIDRFNQISTDTQMKTPDNQAWISIGNSRAWGAYDNAAGRWIPLSIGQGGTGATNASSARINLGLGTAATFDVGTSNGQLLRVSGDGSGSFGVGALTPVNADGNQVSYGNYNFYRQSGATDNNYFGNWGVGLGMVYNSDGSASNTTKFNMFIRTDGEIHFNKISNSSQQWRAVVKTSLNTTVDSNGFLKTASPVVKVFSDGRYQTNLESEGCTVTRLSIGQYLVEGCQGLNSDAAWGGIDGGFDIPTDRNKQPLIWLDYEVNADGSILIKTYHRTHTDAPAFARNEVYGLNNGDPVDIPRDQFVSVRVEMPADSLYNQKLSATELDITEKSEEE